MNVTNNFPSPSSPIADASGQITDVWWQYLLTLFNRTGGGQGVDAAQFKAAITALQMQENEGSSDATGFLLRRIAELETKLSEGSDVTGPLLRKISDLELQIEAFSSATVIPQGFANVTIAGVPRKLFTY